MPFPALHYSFPRLHFLPDAPLELRSRDITSGEVVIPSLKRAITALHPNPTAIMSFQRTSHPAGYQSPPAFSPANAQPPAAPRLRPITLPSIGSFVINPLLEHTHDRTFDFRHGTAHVHVLVRNQLGQPATHPSTQYLTIRVIDEDYAVNPLNDRLIFVEPRTAIVRNEDVIRAVRDRVILEDQELEELGVRSFGNALFERVWGGLGLPDAEGVCTLRLRRAL